MIFYWNWTIEPWSTTNAINTRINLQKGLLLAYYFFLIEAEAFWNAANFHEIGSIKKKIGPIFTKFQPCWLWKWPLEDIICGIVLLFLKYFWHLMNFIIPHYFIQHKSSVLLILFIHMCAFVCKKFRKLWKHSFLLSLYLSGFNLMICQHQTWSMQKLLKMEMVSTGKILFVEKKWNCKPPALKKCDMFSPRFADFCTDFRSFCGAYDWNLASMHSFSYSWF